MHELSITRFIAAPTERVWDIMVNRTGEWWCPKPWRAEVTNWERRPGGASEVVMYGPDGEVSPHTGIFLAWDEGRRFVTTDAVTPELEPAGPFMIGTWEVVPEGDGTRYTASAKHWTEEAQQRHAEMGFEPGWGACADQLKELAEAG